MLDHTSDQNLERTIADYFDGARDDHKKIMSLFAFTPNYSQVNVYQCLRFMLYECPLKQTERSDIAFFLLKHAIRNRDMLPRYEKDAIQDLNKHYNVIHMNNQITEAHYTLKQAYQSGEDFNGTAYDARALDLLRVQYVVEAKNMIKRNTTSKALREYATTLTQLLGSESAELDNELSHLSDDMIDRYHYLKERVRKTKPKPPPNDF